MSKSPSSAKRLAANRANAALSTGPRTVEGKCRSAQNARKHSFAAEKFIVRDLDEVQTLANLRDDAMAVYQPVNSQETFAVERIALAQLSLLRMNVLEAGLFSHILEYGRVGFDKQSEARILAGDSTYMFGLGMRRFVEQYEVPKLFLRYQAQAERLYRRAVADFERLKALRQDSPNEPIGEVQPEEAAPLTAVPPDRPEAPSPLSDLSYIPNTVDTGGSSGRHTEI